MTEAPFRPSPLTIVQLVLVAAVLAGGMLLPPARGAMLLVPLHGQPPAATLDAALAHGARIGMAGPLPGSLVVRGERGRLLRPLFAEGILLLAAPAIWCGR